MLVDARSTPDEVAQYILSFFPHREKNGRGRDWEYAGWYVELLDSARENRNLPVGDEKVTVAGREHWTFLPEKGNSIPEPPPVRPDGMLTRPDVSR